MANNINSEELIEQIRSHSVIWDIKTSQALK